MKKIERLWIRRPIEEKPNISLYGSFSDEPTAFAVSARSLGYKWFNPANVSDMEQAQANYQTVADIITGERDLLYVCAAALIETSATTGKQWLRNTIESSGMGGVESDASESELRDIEVAEMVALRQTLKELGFEDEDIDTAQVGEPERGTVAPEDMCKVRK